MTDEELIALAILFGAAMFCAGASWAFYRSAAVIRAMIAALVVERGR